MELITTLSAADVRNIVDATGLASYGGNIAADVSVIRHRRDGRNLLRVKVNVTDSRGPGARRSWSGRRGPWACWHLFRDVMAAWLTTDPDAIIRTGVTTYRGAADFLATYAATGERNAGSAAEPVAVADLCDCERLGGRDDVRRVEQLERALARWGEPLHGDDDEWARETLGPGTSTAEVLALVDQRADRDEREVVR